MKKPPLNNPQAEIRRIESQIVKAWDAYREASNASAERLLKRIRALQKQRLEVAGQLKTVEVANGQA